MGKSFCFTESQNGGVARDLCGSSSSPTLLLKQSHLQQAAQDFVQAGLEYLQRRRLHNLSGSRTSGILLNMKTRGLLKKGSCVNMGKYQG